MAIDKITSAAIADGAVSADTLTSTAITGQTAETSIADDDLILLSDTSASAALKKMTRANFVSGVGESNTPAFQAYLSSNQSISASATTKVAFDGEHFDTAGAYDTSNYKFTVPSGQAGKYFFYSNIVISNGTGIRLIAYYRKNGSAYFGRMEATADISGADPNLFQGLAIDLAVNDYIEVYYIGSSSGDTLRADNQWETIFGGYKITS